MTKTIQLDPAALEAAARATYEARNVSGVPWDSPIVKGNVFREGKAVDQATAAITAYLAAIEPQVRERLRAFEIEAKASGYGIGGAVENTRGNLLALFGMEAE